MHETQHVRVSRRDLAALAAGREVPFIGLILEPASDILAELADQCALEHRILEAEEDRQLELPWYLKPDAP